MKKISLNGAKRLTKRNIFSIFGHIMIKSYAFSAAFMAILLISCSSKQVGLKENWIDERDVIALREGPVSQWMAKAGRPTVVELVGDTNIYYYNYRPTMYASVVYDSTTFFKTWGSVSESKPASENATEVWGSRKNILQIKAINDVVISAIITEGPDQKVFVRDLNGNIVVDTKSGYNANLSQEQKITSASKDFKNALSSLSGKNTWPPKPVQALPLAADSAKAVAAEPAPVATAQPAAADTAKAAEPAHVAADHAAQAAHHENEARKQLIAVAEVALAEAEAKSTAAAEVAKAAAEEAAKAKAEEAAKAKAAKAAPKNKAAEQAAKDAAAASSEATARAEAATKIAAEATAEVETAKAALATLHNHEAPTNNVVVP
jgi:hypothetical protein